MVDNVQPAVFRGDGQLQQLAIFRIAHWKAMSYRRDRARERKHAFNEQLLLELSNEAQTFFWNGTDARREALAVCLRRLPAEHMSLLQEHYSKGETLTEIALRTRRKPSALHKTLSRIRLALRQCINARMRRGHDPQ